MSTPVIRRLLVAGIALFPLFGCTNKKQVAEIKRLEAELETVQEENTATVNELHKQLSELEETSRTAAAEASQKIQEITAERDTATQQLAALKSDAKRAEAARVAKEPKDASTPGHPDFDPAKETKITQAVAAISGDVSSGNGFVVAIGDKRYLYTAGHILSGNTRLSISNSAGTKFSKFGNLETVEGSPFVRLELLDAADVPALELVGETAQVKAGAAVAALGATTAGGTITAERGEVIGQTNDAIDIDANTLTGRSGGPLIDIATGKVIAVIVNPGAERNELWIATPAAIAAAGGGLEIPHRACRLNRPLQWKAGPVASFLADGKKINDYDAITRVAQALSVLSPTPNGLGLQASVSGGDTALAILTAASKDMPIAGEVIAMNAQLSGKKNVRASDADLKKRFASLISGALSQMQRSSVGFEPAKFNGYHRHFAENSIKWRKEAVVKLQGMGGKSE